MGDTVIKPEGRDRARRQNKKIALTVGVLFATCAAAIKIGVLDSLQPAATFTPHVTRISKAYKDAPKSMRYNGAHSMYGSISTDGRYVAYESTASDLTPDDKDTGKDIFLWDKKTGENKLISHTTEGSSGNEASSEPSISWDGRYIVFSSKASDLVTNDTNDATDIFMWSRSDDSITRISVASDGAQANDSSFSPSIGGDYVVFHSSATNLDTSVNTRESHIYARNFASDTTFLVSKNTKSRKPANGKSTSPRIAQQLGDRVVFKSHATNLVAGDTNDKADVFVYDFGESTMERVSVYNDKQFKYPAGYPSISGYGEFVAFSSEATMLRPFEVGNIGLYISKPNTGYLKLAGRPYAKMGADQDISYASLDEYGKRIVFASFNPNLVKGDSNNNADTFVYDRETEATNRVSLSETGEQLKGDSGWGPAINGLGDTIIYSSMGTVTKDHKADGTMQLYATTYDQSFTRPTPYESLPPRLRSALTFGALIVVALLVGAIWNPKMAKWGRKMQHRYYPDKIVK